MRHSRKDVFSDLVGREKHAFLFARGTESAPPGAVPSLEALLVGRFELNKVPIKDLIKKSLMRLKGLIERLVCLSGWLHRSSPMERDGRAVQRLLGEPIESYVSLVHSQKPAPRLTH